MKILMPQLGETVTEGTIDIWHKKPGDAVTKDELLLDVETEKVAVEIPAPVSGILSRILVAAGETVDVGTLLAEISIDGETSAGSDDSEAGTATESEQASRTTETIHQAAPAGTKAAAKSTNGDGLRLSPAVRRLIAEHDLDISIITGTGRDGRCTKRDVMAYLDNQADQAPLTESINPDRGERLPFDRIRRVIAAHMVSSKATSPHVLQTIEVNFNAVDKVRLQKRVEWKQTLGYSLSYLPFIARAVCLAIKDFPRINASVDGDSLITYADINLAIAVDLNFEGLVAPVIRSANEMKVSQLAQQFSQAAQRARKHELTPEDLSGGTYTISNPGPFGTLFTAPIINQPQVAILSTDAVSKKPVVIESPEGDTIGIRPVGVLAQSFDHRAFDGAYSAAFLNRLKSLLEQQDWILEF